MLQDRILWCSDTKAVTLACRDVVKKYGIKYFYDITDRSDFRANPDYKGVCHVALAQEGHCKPGRSDPTFSPCLSQPCGSSSFLPAPCPSGSTLWHTGALCDRTCTGADVVLCSLQARSCLGLTRTHAMRALLGSLPLA